MAVGSMLGLLLIGIIAGIISLFSKGGLIILTGLCIGIFVWSALLFWPGFPIVSAVLILLAVLRAMKAPAGGLFFAAVVFIILFFAWQIMLVNFVNREVISELKIINPSGKTGKALVVYHSKTGFTKRVSYAFAQGLENKGWRIEITTASSKAPTNVSGYDLVVLASPTYDWKPSERIQKYLISLGDLKGKPTVSIIVGEGYTVISQPAMEDLIKKSNGKLVKSLALWSLRPNIINGEIVKPEDIARQAAEEI